ncbi:MAG: hypothetical protein H6835_05735 [Planctomycetes bacterium]|nr:hypothetical protein [Planctomycetota bacterium]
MSQKVQQFESLFRQITPLFLLGLLLAVLFESWLPYIDWLRATFGEQIVLKAALALTIGYVLLLWGETLRLHGLLTGVLEAFRAFERERRGEGGGGGGGSDKSTGARNPKARIEAARLLIAAMRSGDASIRETSHHNLIRLVGQDLGVDPDAWQSWLDEQPGA